MKRVLVPLAAGFEEIEAVTIVDVLRRAGIEVVLAGLDGAGSVEGAHGLRLEAPVGLQSVANQDFDMIVLPGGEPGTTHLAADAGLAGILRRHDAAAKPLGAICAAPSVLAAHGLLANLAATSYPGYESKVQAGGARYRTERVVRDGRVLTSRGPGTALEFALAIVELLGDPRRAADLRHGMLVAGES
jgi:4-methyl-5(b-hydroxyethyl)-thiazole monophosphate biosynthesis